MSRVEILILLTPRLVQEPEAEIEGQRGADEFIIRQNIVRDHTNPIARRYLGRKALRKAQAALAEGDRATAMRMASKAVFFDPENQQAINFREDLHSPGGPPAPAPQPSAVSPGPALDGDEIAPWVLEELGESPLPPAPAPRDAGQPGKILPLKRDGLFGEQQP